MTAVLESAGRANPKVNIALKGAGILAKALVPISVAFSTVSISIAPDWEAELAKQISSWSRAILLRSFSVELGRLVGPAGAVLGGIAGTIVATILDDNQFPDLIDWFYGGSSRSSASEILGDVYESTHEAARRAMIDTGSQYHVHRVYTGDLSAVRQSPSQATDVVDGMVLRSIDKEPQENNEVCRL